jgi:signal transduction histidine kinase
MSKSIGNETVINGSNEVGLNAALLHEVRTLVTNIGCALERIEISQGREAKEMADTGLAIFADLKTLLNGGLDLAAINAGKKSTIGTKIGSLTRVAADVQQGAANLKNVEVTTSVDDLVPEYIETDPARVRQVLTNLLMNAVKFTPEDGKVELSVSFSAESNSVHFSVKDSGIGMSEQTRQSLFQAFEQAPGTNTKFGGTGLGLYISRLIVEALGGTIGVDSKEGEGSTFYFDLPVSAKQ